MEINVLEFAKNKQSICSTLDVQNLERVKEITEGIQGALSFKLSGDINEKNRAVLKLYICGKITASCQNCLELVEITVENNIVVPVFNTEEELDDALLDKNNADCDGIVANTQLNVLDFVEDEIIMLIPVALRHENC
ncbi:MAG: hypothetical protein LW807_05290 [Proteobacteria bacterium]|jgi:uncharacterized protein|nr:hypothetical protein [Pseudomonadota bacterium]